MRSYFFCGALLVGCATERTKVSPPTAEPTKAVVAPTAKVEPAVGSAIELKAPPVPLLATGNLAANDAPKTTAPKTESAKVKISVHSTPHATVYWGRKKIGDTPFSFDRPRNSGPVDLVLRAQGYLPLHTRAYSFQNDVISVRLTKLEEKQNLFGAKKELPPPLDPAAASAGTGAATDPGAPAAPTPAPVTP